MNTEFRNEYTFLNDYRVTDIKIKCSCKQIKTNGDGGEATASIIHNNSILRIVVDIVCSFCSVVVKRIYYNLVCVCLWGDTNGKTLQNQVAFQSYISYH